jgi:hypothetical protein
MPGSDSSQERTSDGAWERAWSERYEPPSDTKPRRRQRPLRRPPVRSLLLAATVLAIAVTSIAFAGTGEDRGVSAARGEGGPVTLGERNPGSGESARETAIVANAGNGGLVLRPSNTAKGGRAVSATCDNDGTAPEDGCAVYVNKGQGAAASFRTQGAVPFALRDTNTGLVQFLNADMVDGKHAADFLGRGERAADSNLLGGSPASAFLGATAKAADAETIDGKDSSEFLGSSAKAADAHTVDGVDSIDLARFGGVVFISGSPATLGFTSQKTALGTYRVDLPAGMFSDDSPSLCENPIPMVIPLASTPLIATANTAQCFNDGSARFIVNTFTAATSAAADSAFYFMVM